MRSLIHLILAEVMKDKGHSGPVVAIKPLIDSEEESRSSDETDLNPVQICSLDEGGSIIIWTVIQSYRHSRTIVQDLGLAHWSKVSLVYSSSISIRDLSSLIHVWDLSKSDMYPQLTIPFGTLSAMQLSPYLNDDKNPPHMALATGPGSVEIHQLKREYFSQSSNEISKELDKFMHYTSIL
ncbi:hypothetical protein C0J52_13914 [Blattella germanica]|nr:hypothetical protein C0J52_13914 [Blattella germanica]